MKPPVGPKNLKPSGAARSRVDSNLLLIWNDSTRLHFFELIEWHTTFSDGCLGSHNDEERSEMRYVMRIARPRESLILWTHIALPGNSWEHAYLSVSELLSASSHRIIVMLITYSKNNMSCHVMSCVRWLDFGDACCLLTMNCLLQDMMWRDTYGFTWVMVGFVVVWCGDDFLLSACVTLTM